MDLLLTFTEKPRSLTPRPTPSNFYTAVNLRPEGGQTRSTVGDLCNIYTSVGLHKTAHGSRPQERRHGNPVAAVATPGTDHAERWELSDVREGSTRNEWGWGWRKHAWWGEWRGKWWSLDADGRGLEKGETAVVSLSALVFPLRWNFEVVGVIFRSHLDIVLSIVAIGKNCTA